MAQIMYFVIEYKITLFYLSSYGALISAKLKILIQICTHIIQVQNPWLPFILFSASDLSKGYIVSWACAWYGTSLTHSCRGSISTISILITKIWKFYSQQWVIIGQQKQAKIWKTKIVKERATLQSCSFEGSLAVYLDKTKIHLFLGQNSKMCDAMLRKCRKHIS